jgi:hypothetical protein
MPFERQQLVGQSFKLTKHSGNIEFSLDVRDIKYWLIVTFGDKDGIRDS